MSIMKHNLLRLFLFVHVFCGFWCASAWSIDYEYKPDTQKIAYSRKVPEAIERLARKVGPSRFFGTFERAGRKFAIHIYDTSRVKAVKQEYTRSSCLDVFELKAGKTWQRIQRLPMQRTLDERRDKLAIEVLSMWFNPERKTVPFVSIQISGENFIGNEVRIYGALPTVPDRKNFLLLHNYMPYSNTAVTLSKISYPDANGNLTILDIYSEPEGNGYTPYVWIDDSWKELKSDSSQNGFETARAWNGTKFVPLTEWPKTP